MQTSCIHCHAEIDATDRYCPQCGEEVDQNARTQNHREESSDDADQPDAEATSTFQPLPESSQAPERRRRRRKRPLYRRKRVLIPLVMLLLALPVSVFALNEIGEELSHVTRESTPPPVITGDFIGGDSRLEIDTSATRQEAPADEGDNDADEGDSDSDSDSDEEGGGFWDNVRTGAGAVSSSAGVGSGIQSSSAAVEDEPLTIMLMGVDAREGDAIDVGVRPDVLAVLHLEPEHGTCRLLSIPRDTRTELPGYGESKVNHALAIGGISYQKQVVELLLGTEVDHYGLINFTGTIQLVDSVGGVTLTNPEAFTVGDETFAEGQISLDGEQALAYARYRGGADGDFGRIDRQQQIVQAIVSEASNMDIVRNAPSMLNLVGDHTRTDLTVDELLQLVGEYRATCTESTLEMENLDGSVQTLPDPLLEMDLSYVIVEEEEIRRQVEWLTGE